MVTITYRTVVDVITLLFVLSTMFSMGLKLEFREIAAVLLQKWLMVKSLVINLVAIPLLAFGLLFTMPLRTEHTVGFLLVAIAPGAPFGPKLAEFARDDIAFASGLMAVLATISIITVPISVALLMPASVGADPIRIARTVLTTQILPLGVGLCLNTYRQQVADYLRSPIQRLSTLLFLFMVPIIFIPNRHEVFSLVGDGPLVLSTVVVVGALLLGYVVGGPARGTRKVLATTTATRNSAIALVIATTSFPSPVVLTVIISFGLVSVVLSGALVGGWRKTEDGGYPGFSR